MSLESGSPVRTTGQTIHTSDDVTFIKEELVVVAIEDYYKMIKEEPPPNDVNIVQDPLSITSEIEEETQLPTQTGPSARITGQTIHTSNDVTCIKEELVDDTVEDYYEMIEEEPPANDFNILKDPLSISSDIKEETQLPTQTVQATDNTTVATDVKEEWIDGVTWKDIEKDDATDSVGEVFAVKEENDVISRQIGGSAEGEQAGTSEGVIIELENSVGEAQMASGGAMSIILKKNKIRDLMKTYSCYTCAYSSESKAKLRRHVVVHFKGKPYACDVCGSKFSYPSCLKRHKRIHSGEKPYACDVCESRFSHPTSLKNHKLNHSGEKPYACDVCESRFSHLNSLKIHKLTHSGEKPHSCNLCQSRFAHLNSLKRHRLIHSGEKPYACDICESRFAHSSSLKSHRLNHSGEKPYACDLCESSFTRSGHLKSHKLTHSGEKPYACDVCESRFTQSSNLMRHMLTHKGRPYIM